MNRGQRQRVQDVAVDGQGEECRYLARTRLGPVSWCCHFGADQRGTGMPMSQLCWALARAALGAGVRHSALDEAASPHDHQIAMLLPPRQIYIHGAAKLGVAAGGGAGTPARALGAVRLSAMNGQGCCCGMGAVLCRVALGTRLRWAADGCWSAVRLRGGCGRFATDSMVRWRAAGRGVHYLADR